MSSTSTMLREDDLINRLGPLLAVLRDMTAGADSEQRLNANFGVGTSLYDDVSRLLLAGVRQSWVASVEVAGPRYRRSLISAPCVQTLFFSITAVLLDSTDCAQGNPEGSFRGAYHLHPYGEFNLVVPVDEGAAIAGPHGWCHGGWTAPAPGSHHFPEVKGGAAISLTFLPAGRIVFDMEAPGD